MPQRLVIGRIHLRASKPNLGLMNSDKKRAQDLINAGTLTCVESLREYVAQQGWTLTRAGAAYVGVKTKSGDRFRLFLPSHPKAAAQGRLGPCGREFDFSIYALLAFSDDGKAYYVGQTRNLRRRLREHVKRRDSGAASSALFHWSAARGVPVGIVLLERVLGTQTQANRAERAWQQRAALAGYDDLGAFGATVATTNCASPADWPAEQVGERVQPLLTLVDWLEAGRSGELVPVLRASADEVVDASHAVDLLR